MMAVTDSSSGAVSSDFIGLKPHRLRPALDSSSSSSFEATVLHALLLVGFWSQDFIVDGSRIDCRKDPSDGSHRCRIRLRRLAVEKVLAVW